jgi:IS30 family transposase
VEINHREKIYNVLQVESDEDYTAEEELEEPATSKKKKKKRKKRKKKSGKGFSDNPWQSTSGSSR